MKIMTVTKHMGPVPVSAYESGIQTVSMAAPNGITYVIQLRTVEAAFTLEDE